MAFRSEPGSERAGVSGYRHPPGQAITLLPWRGGEAGIAAGFHAGFLPLSGAGLSLTEIPPWPGVPPRRESLLRRPFSKIAFTLEAQDHDFSDNRSPGGDEQNTRHAASAAAMAARP